MIWSIGAGQEDTVNSLHRAAQGNGVSEVADGKLDLVSEPFCCALGVSYERPDGHAALRQAYAITGPQAITYSAVAADLSAATGRAIEFVNVPDDAARAGLLDAGAPEWFADGLVVLFGMLREGLLVETTGEVRQLTGREPRSFAEFSRDYRAVFVG